MVLVQFISLLMYVFLGVILSVLLLLLEGVRVRGGILFLILPDIAFYPLHISAFYEFSSFYIDFSYVPLSSP